MSRAEYAYLTCAALRELGDGARLKLFRHPGLLLRVGRVWLGHKWCGRPGQRQAPVSYSDIDVRNIGICAAWYPDGRPLPRYGGAGTPQTAFLREAR